MRSVAIILAIAAYSAVASTAGAQEFNFDAAEFEKPAFQIGGYLEGKAEYFRYDRDAAFYRLNTTGSDLGGDNRRGTGTAEIRAKYEKDWFTAFATVNGDGQWDADQGKTREVNLYEGGVTARPATGFSIDLGKKVLKWGKGYGWNPVGFVERTKDPTDPDLSREGFWMLTADYVRSFPQGPLQAIGVTPVIVPVTRAMNDDFGQRKHVNFGGKLYLLYEDTDIDFTVLGSGTRSARYGADFSRNILSNLEVHGEVAYITDAERRALDENDTIVTRRKDALSLLLGLRYLTEADTTYIVEYYRNGPGFAPSETRDFYRLAHNAVDSFESTGSQTLLQQARMLNRAYGRQTPARDYLYVRVSQKEPFDILYFTPSIIGILNLGDRSMTLTPELQYTGITNFEIRLRGAINIGGRLAEFGEKQVGGRVELRVRYFF